MLIYIISINNFCTKAYSWVYIYIYGKGCGCLAYYSVKACLYKYIGHEEHPYINMCTTYKKVHERSRIDLFLKFCKFSNGTYTCISVCVAKGIFWYHNYNFQVTINKITVNQRRFLYFYFIDYITSQSNVHSI